MKTTIKIPMVLLAAALSATAISPLAAAVQPPQPTDQPAPAYPFDLRKEQREGQVTLLFTVTADGRVANPVVTQSSNWVFRDLVLNAVRKWKYTPAMEDGHPVSAKISQRFVFVVPEKEA
jgi:protein TonB